MSESVSRIVLRAPNWLGDAVLALPAMVALRRHFSSAYLAVAGPPGVAAIFREETDVKPDSVIEISDRSREVIATLQGGGFDLGVLFPNSFRSAWKLKRAGIKERWGFATFPRGWLLTNAATSNACSSFKTGVVCETPSGMFDFTNDAATMTRYIPAPLL